MNLKSIFALLTLLFFSVVLSAQVKREDDNDKASRKFHCPKLWHALRKPAAIPSFYDATQVNVKQEVSLNVKQVSVSKAVGEMLKGIDLSFEVTSTQIALFPKKEYSGTNGQGDYNHR